jgi:hypothetical protein
VKAVLMASIMNEESILKRTLILTGKLVGAFSIWVAIVTVVATVVATRLVVALSGAPADRGAPVPTEASKKDEAGSQRIKNPPVNSTNKPNG